MTRCVPALVLCVPLLTAVSSCQMAGGGEPPEVGQSSAQIIGGVEDSGDPAVVQVRVFGSCTGTLVAPRVVLTAAHCVAGAIESGQTYVGSVQFGSRYGQWEESISIVDMAMHRMYRPPAFIHNDIALVRLAEPAPESIKPVPISRVTLTSDHIGLDARVVGFGHSDGVDQTGAGVKRHVRLTVDEIRPGHIGIGTASRNTCQGDSGGPTMADFGEGEVVIAVTSYGSDDCHGRSYMSRTDVHWDVFLTPVLNAWAGECPADGSCEEDCAQDDPDCDICAFEGICDPECEIPDLDCPLGGLDGFSCADDYDCESRTCIEASDDPRIRYCSLTCDPGAPVGQACPAPLRICESRGDGGVCVYPGVTPSAQGADCDIGSDCRSGVCEPDLEMCVEPCGEGLPACPEPFECVEFGGGARACGVADESGACRAGGSSSGRGSVLVAAFGLLVWGGRRRRARKWR